MRKLPASVARTIEQKAKQNKTSLNKTVVRLLEEATGFSKKETVIYHDLDRLAGSWTSQEALFFENALAKQRQIEPGMWKQ